MHLLIWSFDQVPRDAVWWSLEKIGGEEWWVWFSWSMYRNVRNQVRLNGSFGNDILVQVGLHQSYTLLFIVRDHSFSTYAKFF